MTDRLVPATYATIGAALAVSLNGDRVLDSRAPGSYAEALTAYSALSNIQLLPQNSGITLALGNSWLSVGNGWLVGDTYGYSIENTVSGQAAVVIDSGPSPKIDIIFNNCTITRSNIGFSTVLVSTAVGHAATVSFNNCTISHPGGRHAIEQSGSAVPTVTLTDCTLGPASRGVELAAPAPVLICRRVHFLNCFSAGVATNGGAVAGTWTLLDCVSDGIAAGPILDWNTTTTGSAVLDVSGCTAICSGAAGFKRTSSVAATGVIQNCWADTFEFPIGASCDYNGYRVLSMGVPGAHDVVTAADPGFVDLAGGNYRLTIASALRDAGIVDGETCDYYGDQRVRGIAQDIGAAEYQFSDCGVSTWTQTDSLTARCIFAPSTPGPQIPLQASAEASANWTLTATPSDATLVVLTATRVSDLIYDIGTTHRMAPGASIEVDTSAIATDAGGLCDDPATASFTAVADAEPSGDYDLPLVIGPMGLDGGR